VQREERCEFELELDVCFEGLLSMEFKLCMGNPSLIGVVENIIFMRQSQQI
jgi:hypothetical protein